MLRLIASAMLVMLMLAVPNAGAAPIVFDNFSDPAAGQTVNSGSLTGSFASVTGPGIFNSGTRDLSYTGVNAATGDTWRTLFGEILSVNGGLPGRLGLATFDSAVEIILKYTAFGTLDASGFTTLDLVFDTVFDNGASDFDINIVLTTGSGLLSGTFTAPGSFVPSGGTLSIPLSTLTGPGSLSSITQIDIRLNDSGSPSSSADFALDTIQFANPVPEPATLALWGTVTLGGLWYGRRRLKANPTA